MHDPSTPLRRTRLWDGLGILVSSVCLVHCLAPAVLAGSAVFLGGHEHGSAHGWFFATAAVAGLLAFLPGWRHHRSRLAPSLAAAGFLALGLGLFAAHDLGETAEVTLTVVGGALLLSAHVVNIAQCRRGHPCPADGRG